MKRKFSPLKFAFSYSGCFIGAGYLSGQELWQFFGSFGKYGWAGLVIAFVLQSVFAYYSVMLAVKLGSDDFAALISEAENSFLKKFFFYSAVIFVFLTLTVTVAGAKSCFESVTGKNGLWFSALFSLFVFFGATRLSGGATAILSVSVPLLTAATFSIAVYVVCKFGFPNVYSLKVTGKTLLLPNFFISAAMFAGHNFFCSLGTIVPAGKNADKKSAAAGSAISGALSLTVAAATLLPICVFGEFSGEDLPILKVAEKAGAPLFLTLSVLLFIAAFGSATSCVGELGDFMKTKGDKKTPLAVAVVCAFALSFFGFKKLIAVAYPLCGITGLAAAVIIAYNFKKSSREYTFRKKTKEIV